MFAIATTLVHAGRPDRTPDSPLSAPPVLASTYVEGGPIGYARSGNPTWTALEEVLGALEGGQALAFASGMAAVAAVLDLLPERAVLVAPSSPYGGTSRLLDQIAANRGIEVRRVDVADTEATLAAMTDATMLFVESPTNPMLAVADLPALFAAGRQRGVICCADNTFATPLNQRPLDLGADVVVHSVTKYLSGHSDLLLGAAVTRDKRPIRPIARASRLPGRYPGPDRDLDRPARHSHPAPAPRTCPAQRRGARRPTGFSPPGRPGPLSGLSMTPATLGPLHR